MTDAAIRGKFPQSMLNVKNLSQSFGGRTLLHQVSFHVNRDDRIALVGPNGSGKSTIFRIIMGEQAPDDGAVVCRPGATIGYLPQETAVAGAATVLETAAAVTPAVAGWYETLRVSRADSEAAHAARARLDEACQYEVEPRAQKILAGLGFCQSDFDRPLKNMSGGWIMRAHLARLLAQGPDLLMLDEPTNHLDLSSLIWLQEYLQKYSGAILMISHDREFINRIINQVLEISRTDVARYRGNYDDYTRERAARREQQLAAHKNQQKEMATLQRFADRFRAKATKAAQAQSKLKQIERMEKIAAPEAMGKTVAFHWPQPPRSARRVMTLAGIHQAYGAHTVYRDLHYAVERGERTVLVGPNGAGKSTLLKLLAGVLPFQSGSREPGLNVKTGYYAQHRLEMLSPGHTVLEEALTAAAGAGERAARNLLGAFLFRGDDVFKRVGVLSGGEKSRLALVKLMLDPPNFLLMDEPTTHLDIPSMDALIAALREYHGTLVFISHDVYFIRAIARSVLHINAGRLTPCAGDYAYYLERTQADSERAALTAGGQTAAGAPGAAPARRQSAARRNRQLEHRRKVGRLESRIAAMEIRQTELTAQLQDAATHETPGAALAVSRELKQIVATLHDFYREWETMAEMDAGNGLTPQGG